MAVLTVVTWKWERQPGFPVVYTAGHVNALRRAVAAHYDRPHRFVCVTDDPTGLDRDVEVVPLCKRYAHLRNPSNRSGPNCYMRLFAFSEEAGEVFGERFVSMDLDIVVTGDLVQVWDRDEDFVICHNPSGIAPYNGSMWLLRAGTRREVWERFDPKRSPVRSKALGYFGSDQAHIAAVLGTNEATWTEADGVYSYRRHIQRTGQLPENARLVFFAGRDKPWHPPVRRRNPWIEEHRA